LTIIYCLFYEMDLVGDRRAFKMKDSMAARRRIGLPF